MILFKKALDLQLHLLHLKQEGCKIGFAPTMGALHAGHISLIEQSKHLCDITVCSIFINPTQFNDSKDFEKYPVTIANDVFLLENAGCDILFLPSVSEIYPNGTTTSTHYNLGEIEFVLEGKFRPGHFQGVCQVVHKLLELVVPDYLIIGQKDYQQCLVIKRLVELVMPSVEVVTSPTYREHSGLAMSSRNVRLNELEKKEAAAIAEMLDYIRKNYTTSGFKELAKYATDFLLNAGFKKVDYVSIADSESLKEVNTPQKGQKLIVLIAAFMSDVRLIDNMILNG